MAAMKGRNRVSREDYNTGTPLRELAWMGSGELSEKARFRLKVVDRYSREVVQAVREIREADPTYSARKTRPILSRTISGVPSVPTPGKPVFQAGHETAHQTLKRRSKSP
jgi:hypothetical protein